MSIRRDESLDFDPNKTPVAQDYLQVINRSSSIDDSIYSSSNGKMSNLDDGSDG